jgi:hypothetical protein
MKTISTIPVIVKNRADMIRVIKSEGTVIETVSHWLKERFPVGHLRKVCKAQNNGFFYHMPSDKKPEGERCWCPFPKASSLSFNNDGTVTFFPGEVHSWTFRFYVDGKDLPG